MNVQLGDVVNLGQYGRCTVISNDDPATITLESEAGATLRLGERVFMLMVLAQKQDARPTA